MRSGADSKIEMILFDHLVGSYAAQALQLHRAASL